MSTLSKRQILDWLERPVGGLVVTPILSPRQIGTISIDLRLGGQFIVFRSHTRGTIDPFRESEAEVRQLQERRVIRFGGKLVLHPGALVLASSFEYVSMPMKLEGQVEGRSSWARVGLQIATASPVEPGFRGVVTLELSNLGTMPLELHPGTRVAQLLLREISTPPDSGYGNRRKYRFPVGPEFSRLHEDTDARAFINSTGSCPGV